MPIEDTGQNIRARVRMPSEFESGSFRTIDIDTTKGIKAVIGKLKGKDTTTAQSYIFSKDKGWTIPKVETWLKENNLTAKSITLEKSYYLDSFSSF